MARKAFIMASNGPESMGRLKYAEEDAKVFAEKLQSLRYGFEIVMPEKGSDPYDTLKLLGNTALACEREDDFICYFSGHGDLAKGKLQLVLSDEPKPVEMISMDVDIIQSYIQKCRSKNKLLILDCCHSGGAVGMKSGGGADKLVQDVTPFNDNDNHIVLVASERLSKIREYNDLKGSFLTRKICEALEEQFHVVDKDKDQRISITDVLEYLQLSRNKYNVDKSDDKKVPLPYIFGQQKGAEFYFTNEKLRWSPIELACEDESLFVILPVPPRNGKCLCIAKHPVTNAQYKSFIKQKKHREPQGRFLVGLNADGELEWKQDFEPLQDPAFNGDNQPVVCISYNDAMKYCEWVERKADKWLQTLPPKALTSVFVPTQELWNIAAYGSLYSKENYGNSEEWLGITKAVHDKFNSPENIFDEGWRTNARGITDMFGNVWEWCAPHITTNYSLKRLYRGNPVIRGGGFHDDLSSVSFVPRLDTYLIAKGDKVEPSDFRSYDLGLRLAAQVEVSKLPQEVQVKLSLCPAIDERFWFDIDNRGFKD
jgi:formylglycine-generating enzyme required for sulfatase activity